MPLGFINQARALTEVTVKVVLAGAALDRSPSEIRQAVRTALERLGNQIEGRLERVTPRRSGRTARGWTAVVEPVWQAGENNVMVFRFAVENISPAARWIARLAFGLAFRQGKAALALGDTLQDVLIDNLERLSLGVGSVELVSRSRTEIVLAMR